MFYVATLFWCKICFLWGVPKVIEEHEKPNLFEIKSYFDVGESFGCQTSIPFSSIFKTKWCEDPKRITEKSWWIYIWPSDLSVSFWIIWIGSIQNISQPESFLSHTWSAQFRYFQRMFPQDSLSHPFHPPSTKASKASFPGWAPVPGPRTRPSARWSPEPTRASAWPRPWHWPRRAGRCCPCADRHRSCAKPWRPRDWRLEMSGHDYSVYLIIIFLLFLYIYIYILIYIIIILLILRMNWMNC